MIAQSLPVVGLHSVFWQATERWLSLTLSAALIPLLLEWLSKARAKPSPEGYRTMVYPHAYGHFGLAFATACWVAAGFIWASDPGALLVVVIFITVSLFGLAAYASVRVTRLELSPDGVRERRIFRQPAFTRWSDVMRMERRARALALEGRSGNTLKISFSLHGLRDFARLSLTSIPDGRIESEARAVLERMAAGELPEP